MGELADGIFRVFGRGVPGWAARALAHETPEKVLRGCTLVPQASPGIKSSPGKENKAEDKSAQPVTLDWP